MVVLSLRRAGVTGLSFEGRGERIAQLVFHKLITKEKIKPRLLATKYIGATGPSFSKLHEDKDWNVIKKLRRSCRKR